MTPANHNLKIKIFADGANKSEMLEMSQNAVIKGLTTNPSLMRKAGVENYKEFALDVLSKIKDKPISFEVFSDDLNEMERQAIEISSWAKNVYVKLPITNTKGITTSKLIKYLSDKNIKLNVTAVFTLKQVNEVLEVLNKDVDSYISVFAGRIADTGVDPIPLMQKALIIMKNHKNCELIWASPREMLNIFQADSIGCHIITVSGDIIQKLKLIGYDHEKYSLETVKMFYDDGVSSGFKI